MRMRARSTQSWASNRFFVCIFEYHYDYEDRVAKYPARPATPTTPSHGNNPV